MGGRNHGYQWKIEIDAGLVVAVIGVIILGILGFAAILTNAGCHSSPDPKNPTSVKVESLTSTTPAPTGDVVPPDKCFGVRIKVVP